MILLNLGKANCLAHMVLSSFDQYGRWNRRRPSPCFRVGNPCHIDLRQYELRIALGWICVGGGFGMRCGGVQLLSTQGLAGQCGSNLNVREQYRGKLALEILVLFSGGAVRIQYAAILADVGNCCRIGSALENAVEKSPIK